MGLKDIKGQKKQFEKGNNRREHFGRIDQYRDENDKTRSGLGSKLALSLLFLDVKFESALAAFRWSGWRLDGMLLKSEEQVCT